MLSAHLKDLADMASQELQGTGEVWFPAEWLDQLLALRGRVAALEDRLEIVGTLRPSHRLSNTAAMLTQAFAAGEAHGPKVAEGLAYLQELVSEIRALEERELAAPVVVSLDAERARRGLQAFLHGPDTPRAAPASPPRPPAGPSRGPSGGDAA
jgi:hypothetical protein